MRQKEDQRGLNFQDVFSLKSRTYTNFNDAKLMQSNMQKRPSATQREFARSTPFDARPGLSVDCYAHDAVEKCAACERAQRARLTSSNLMDAHFDEVAPAANLRAYRWFATRRVDNTNKSFRSDATAGSLRERTQELD